MLPCISGSFLPLLFQPLAMLVRGPTRKGWGQGGSFTCWERQRGPAELALGTSLQDLPLPQPHMGQPGCCDGVCGGSAPYRPGHRIPAGHQQTTLSRRTVRVAELACIWQELSLLFALEEIKTSGALAIATVSAWYT